MVGRKGRSGSKPRGEFPGKSAAFTTRIQPETRRALVEAQKASGRRSISAMAEFLLKTALKKPAGEPRNQAIAAAIVTLAENIERDTAKEWNADQWTGMALRHAVEALLFHFAPTPNGEPAIPPAIEMAAAKMPDEFAKQYRKPAGFGHISAYRLIDELKVAASTEPPNEWTPIIFSERPGQLALIARDLGLAAKKRKSK